MLVEHLVGDLGRAIRLPELTAAVQQAFYEPLARVIKAGADDGSLKIITDPESDAVVVLGAIMMTAVLYNVIASGKSENDVARQVIDLVMNGLAPGSGQRR